MYDMSHVPHRRHAPRPPWPHEEVERFRAQVAEVLAEEVACADCQAMKDAGPEGLEAVEWAEGSGSRPPVCHLHQTLRFYIAFPDG